MPANDDSTVTAKKSSKKFDGEAQGENSTASNRNKLTLGWVRLKKWNRAAQFLIYIYIVYKLKLKTNTL